MTSRRPTRKAKDLLAPDSAYRAALVSFARARRLSDARDALATARVLDAELLTYDDRLARVAEDRAG